jgi:hypothetical protein
MRYECCFLLCLLSFGFNLEGADAQESHVTWPIGEIIVYESAARITRIGSVQLNDQGRAHYVVGDLSKTVNEDMVQVQLAEGWSLVSSNHREAMRRGLKSEVRKALEELDAELKSNRQTFAMRNALLEAYNEELSMIQANRRVSGNELLLVEDLQEHADFWRKRVKELKYLMLELKLEIEVLQQDCNQINGSRGEWEEKQLEREGQFVLKFSGPPNASAEVALVYIVSDAAWNPVYEASVASDGSITMKRFAKVSQSTQRDWDEVPLTLTVGRPSQTLAPPVLFPQNIGIATSASSLKPKLKMTQQEGSPRTSMDQTSALDRYDFVPENVAYVNGRGKSERIYIDDFTLPGTLTYLALPTFSDEAYQVAVASEWAQQQLLPGAVNILTNGKHRGVFQMVLPSPGDTLRLPLGQDSRVRCSRKRLVDLCSSSVLGGSRKTTQSFELVVENQYNRSIEVITKDRIPVTKSKDIEVDAVELNGGQLDPISGIVTWNQTLAPLETRTVVVTYTISFPKGHELQGL